MTTTAIVGEEHYTLAQEIRKTLAQYEALKDIVAMLGMEQLSPDDRATVGRARRLERFLTQPFFATEQFSGMKGKQVSLKDALDGCRRILRDEFKDYPESALYMIGAISEAKKPDETKKPDDTKKPAPPPVTKPKLDAVSPSTQSAPPQEQPSTPEPAHAA
jgi:F-type H+-transporting ATPase subunit beta